MKKWLRLSVRDLLMLTAFVAMSLALILQSWRHHEEQSLYQAELARLSGQLHSTQQLLPELPLGDPERVCVLATPSFAHGRWTWRVYLPKGRRYALHVDVGNIVEASTPRTTSAAPGCSQHFGLRGDGETTLIVETFRKNNRELLGISLGRHYTCCVLTPEVARCMASRASYREEQLGVDGAASLEADERITLLTRWFPPTNNSPAKSFGAPAGFSVWLEPF